MLKRKALIESLSFNLHSSLKQTSRNMSLPDNKIPRDGFVGLLAGEPVVSQMARYLPNQWTKFIPQLDRGYKAIELPSSIMGQFTYHLAYATQVVNPQEFTLRKRTVRKCNRIVDKMMASERIQNIITDDTLDS